MSVGVDVLRSAQEEGWALAAFSVYNLEQTVAVCRAAEACQAPVLLQAGSSAFAYAGREPLAALALGAARVAGVPVGVHLDHAREPAEIEACLALGYDSVMFDGSALPLEENIALTSRVVEEAHAVGVWVEAELAGIGGDEDRSDARPADARTDPVAAERFVHATGVDALAVAIGNVHGIPERPVRLDLELLAELRTRVQVPLVLHGSSGLADTQVRDAIALGVCKLNVNAELRRAFRDALVQRANEPHSGDDLASLLAPATAAVEAVAREKIELFRHARKASPAVEPDGAAA
jgi:ketose-bisphosphate aldolase